MVSFFECTAGAFRCRILQKSLHRRSHKHQRSCIQSSEKCYPSKRSKMKRIHCRSQAGESMSRKIQHRTTLPIGESTAVTKTKSTVAAASTGVYYLLSKPLSDKDVKRAQTAVVADLKDDSNNTAQPTSGNPQLSVPRGDGADDECPFDETATGESEDVNHTQSSLSHYQTTTTMPSHTVAISCDICLDEYKVGQVLAWSRNASCPHVFHWTCILDWTAQQNTCPSCRQPYVLMQ
jgi:hypothetical protein